MRDQHSEANPSVISISEWLLSYPTASVHVAGLVITQQGKPIMQWERRKNMLERRDNTSENQPNRVDLSEKARENLRKNAESRLFRR